MHHILKIQTEYLEAKLEGDKPFEIRFNDKGFQKGDTIEYKEVCVNGLSCNRFKSPTYEITYVSHYHQKDGWCVFGDKVIKEEVNA